MGPKLGSHLEDRGGDIVNVEFHYDAFISYSHQDLAFVEWLVAWLIEKGITVFRDVDRLKIGDNWFVSLNDHLARSHRFILVYSPDYFASPMCRWELLTALRRDPDASAGFILPVYHREARLPEYVKHIQYGDFREVSQREARCAELLAVLAGSGAFTAPAPFTLPPGASRLEAMTREELRAMLRNRLSSLNVREICFDLQSKVPVSYDDLGSQKLSEQIILLLETLERARALPLLVEWIARHRRDILERP